jgi:hypothetical protein
VSDSSTASDVSNHHVGYPCPEMTIIRSNLISVHNAEQIAVNVNTAAYNLLKNKVRAVVTVTKHGMEVNKS